ncbi:hypothetical protein AAKU64_000326 [Undibacterium sp. GrIS 1.8]|uniref:hypothetical protein n=1 Tax=Undibacterium sp. GrIS 1.8 TaxID=3143934 RepID=UPI0033969D02
MNINDLESNSDSISDNKLREVIVLLIESARDFPDASVDRLDEFILAVSFKINVPLTRENLVCYMDKYAKEEDLWVLVSLEGLVRVFDLMELYGYSLSLVMSKVREISPHTCD